MTFQDIFKSGFLENVNAISVLDMAAALILSFVMGLFIFYIYKKSYCGADVLCSFWGHTCGVNPDNNTAYSGGDE